MNFEENKKELLKLGERISKIAEDIKPDISEQNENSKKYFKNQNRKVSIKKLKVIELRLSELINLLDNRNMVVPGTLIPRTNTIENSIHYNFKQRLEAPKIRKKDDTSENGKSHQLISPVVQAYITINDDVAESIQIQSILFIDIDFNIKIEDLNLNYSVHFNNSGQEQLNIHIYFSKDPNLLQVQGEYFFYPLNIFLKRLTPEESPHSIPLENIKTVQVFLINVDPRTSRGTITTVQTHNSNSKIDFPPIFSLLKFVSLSK
ncbi:hypothetical protein H2O64_08215 [Kordia sp. YSTF-M3]|uniref:Uncharacterized protein n=1 Tax=Kordia aestuariivivens TaxID=2759037 RepID=A0ABR7Q8H1_9FLAO|nr:hypothetical protein [Kordia aestuariivivens]MBC8754656.1 hypothetical protein [Kordia aestuariivivens]